MILLHFFGSGYGIYAVSAMLILFILYKTNQTFFGCLFNVIFYIIMIPLLFPIALISAIFKCEPKFVKRWEKEIEEYHKKHPKK